MRTKLLHTAAKHERTFAIALDKDEEPIRMLRVFAKRHDLFASRITAIGGFSAAVLGFFDRSRRQYERIPVEQQAEVLSFLGDIAHYDGQPVVHVHAVLGLCDGTTRGGHLLEARVWPTLEIIVSEWPSHMRKELDPDTGLPLLMARKQPLRAVNEPIVPPGASLDELPTWIHDLHPARP